MGIECLNTKESFHFLQCVKNNYLNNNRLSLITNILNTTHTPLSITNIIFEGITSYYNGKVTIETSKFQDKDPMIVLYQNSIR